MQVSLTVHVLMMILASAVLTLIWIRISSHLKIFDSPERRRLHSGHIPRAGGIAIWAVVLVSVFLFGQTGPSKIAFLVGLLSIGLVGLFDDFGLIASKTKFIGQIGSLALAAYFFRHDTLLISIAFICFGLVSVNFWNFMDGSNGMIISQAMLGAAFYLLVSVDLLDVSRVVGIALLAACIGFAPFNAIGKAKVFLGDVGSHVIGYCIFFAVFSEFYKDREASLIACASTLPVWLDASVTLFWRIVKKRNILRAHREHLYQWLIRSGISHFRVMCIYSACSIIAASAVYLFGLDSIFLTSLIFVSLYWIAKWRISLKI
jgi:UDP-N-acetylmuramyl pentapeptide phosphotransferase/UDP-N-acetylglucosamine-1-phosphate transferase